MAGRPPTQSELKAAFAHLARRYANAATDAPAKPTSDVHVNRGLGG